MKTLRKILEKKGLVVKRAGKHSLKAYCPESNRAGTIAKDRSFVLEKGRGKGKSLAKFSKAILPKAGLRAYYRGHEESAPARVLRTFFQPRKGA